MHHALADGISGMLIASALFDLSPDADIGAPPKEPWVPEPAPTGLELAADAVHDLILHPMEAVVRVAEAPMHAAAVIGETLDGLRSIVGMGARPAVRSTCTSGPIAGSRPRGAVQRSSVTPSGRLGGTINDAVLAGVGGGLHDLLAARGEQTRGRTLRVMVPVSVRSKAEQGDVGNRVAPAFVDIPVGSLRPVTRLRRVRAATDALKDSAMAVSADSIIGLGAYAPPALHAMAARLVSRNRWFNLVVSNIPAPQVPMYLAGAQLMASYPAMPLGESCALSIACTSLGGTMSFGLTADWDALPDIDVLARGIERSLHDLAGARPARS